MDEVAVFDGIGPSGIRVTAFAAASIVNWKLVLHATLTYVSYVA